MSIFRLELRNMCKHAVISTLSILCILLGMLAFYPSMKTESMQAIAGAKLDSINPALLSALGLSKMIDFSVMGNYLGYVLQFITLAIMVIFTQQAVSLLIKEETDGTIEYLYAKPISRSGILVQKSLAHMTTMLFMLLSCIAVTTAGYCIFGDYAPVHAAKEVFLLFSPLYFVGLIFSAPALLLSACLKTAKGAAGIALGLVFGSFLFGILASMIKQLSFLRWLAPMDWIKAEKLLSEGLSTYEWLVGCLVILSASLAAWMRYDRKDLLI